MTVKYTNFVVTLMDYFDSEDGRAYIREVLDEIIDNYMRENPNETRENLIRHFNFSQ